MNTDKYEGHTVGDMTFSQAGEKLWFLEHPHSHNASDCMTMNKATLDLIQDAPELLAFYLRVKEIMDMEEIEEIVRVELIWSVMQVMEGQWPRGWEEEE